MKDTRASRGARDFDFVVGTWDVANRRLTQRLVGSTELEEFPGTSECRSILSRSGNVQEIEFPTRGFSGAAPVRPGPREVVDLLGQQPHGPAGGSCRGSARRRQGRHLRR